MQSLNKPAEINKKGKYSVYLYRARNAWDEFFGNADEVLYASGVAGVRYSGISVDEMSL